ncbi:hypothetical protein BH24ACT12_BH24ACT12_28260 [soil metagenome]
MRRPPVATSDRGVAAADLLRALYPAPLDVEVAAKPSDQVRAVWTAVPSADSPRLLVPAGIGRVAARMARRQLTGRRVRTRIARAGLSVAMGTGMLGHVSWLRVAVTGPAEAPCIEDPLCQVLGVDHVRLTLPVGPARANRKAVLQVTDRAGRVLAFAKVGHNELTQRLVRHEGEVLRELEATVLRAVLAPRPLASVTWAGLEIVVLEPLEIPARRASGDERRQRLLAVVREVSGVGGRSVLAWGQHPHRALLLSQIERCGDLAAPLRQQVESIRPALTMPTGAWHGDLNSGNAALVPGACPVWDWERFGKGVPVGFDLLHHDLHEAITVEGVPAREAAAAVLGRAGMVLTPLDVDRSTAEAIARAYLVTLACRYLADDQHEAGADLGNVEDWLLPALESLPVEGGRT